MVQLTDWSDPDGVIIGYMDKVDILHELGRASGGNKVYPSVDALLKSRASDRNDIVEVEVKIKRMLKDSELEAVREECRTRWKRLREKNFIPIKHVKLPDGTMGFVPFSVILVNPSTLDD